MAASAGSATLRLWAARPIALSKQADQPAASSCSGLVPLPAPPGVDSLTSRCPSELRAMPWSRPPVVRTMAVYNSLSPCACARSGASWVMAHSFLVQAWRHCRSALGGDVDDGLRKSLRGFLRQVVPDAARDQPVHILAGEFVCIGAGLRVGR